MNTVWLLWDYNNDYEMDVIGVYSLEEKADAAYAERYLLSDDMYIEEREVE